ncbi:MAG: GNAT family N-acetyltransferase [Prevotellaceae bacterium]|jgi:ribosomal protein S18 acetylase RimI-like enzyme|nr:GNAT family N-acetyltransferase [Prevotellaceae bacterium]
MTDLQTEPNELQIRDSSAEFLIFTGQTGGKSIEVRLQNGTVWLTQKLIAVLFDIDRSVITKHLNNIYQEGELNKEATCAIFAQVQTEGKRQVTRKTYFYNLNAIISVGYRVNSKRATAFRQWATTVLQENIQMNNEITYKKLETKEEIFKAKELIIEYIQWLNEDLTFQNVDDELTNFPQKYKEPDGTFIIAKDNDNVVGCVGLKKLDENICEMKRLFVNDKYKCKGIGKKLVEIIIEEAKYKNYSKMRLDTLKTMEIALKIYYETDFYEIEPYYNNPHCDAVYIEKILL